MNNTILKPIFDEIDEQLKTKRRVIVAIAGAPASGKSTLAEKLKDYYGEKAALVPMDGFHLDNPLLIQRDLLARKGSEPTFDSWGYLHLIKRLAEFEEVYAPRFDREFESSIGSAIHIEHQPIIITEGNYLLLNKSPWVEAQRYFDISLFIDIPIETLQQRLEMRWQKLGLTPSQIVQKIEGNDLLNAHFILENSTESDFQISLV